MSQAVITLRRQMQRRRAWAAGGALANAAEAWGFAAVGSEIRPGQDGGSSKNCEAVTAADAVSYTTGRPKSPAGLPATHRRRRRLMAYIPTGRPKSRPGLPATHRRRRRQLNRPTWSHIRAMRRRYGLCTGYARAEWQRAVGIQAGGRAGGGYAVVETCGASACGRAMGITLTEPKPTQTDDCAPGGTASEPAVPTERTAVAVGQGAGVQPEDEDVDADAAANSRA